MSYQCSEVIARNDVRHRCVTRCLTVEMAVDVATWLSPERPDGAPHLLGQQWARESMDSLETCGGKGCESDEEVSLGWWRWQARRDWTWGLTQNGIGRQLTPPLGAALGASWDAVRAYSRRINGLCLCGVRAICSPNLKLRSFAKSRRRGIDWLFYLCMIRHWLHGSGVPLALQSGGGFGGFRVL